MELGKKIRNLRKEMGKSLEELSKESGLSIGLLSQIEREITGPSVESLWKIAQALNVPINYILIIMRKIIRLYAKIKESR